MKKYFELLKTIPLFKEIAHDDLETILICVGAKIKEISKGEIVLNIGDKPQYIGILLEGQLHISRNDYDGKRSIISAVSAGGIFAEALCCGGIAESPVIVCAEIDCVVMQIAFNRILRICTNACSFHATFIKNMLEILARKNLQLQNRMEIISLKSVRARVLQYLSSFGKTEIIIPFNREQMADYLGVERSALSHELMKMKVDGLIDYKKNKFWVK